MNEDDVLSGFCCMECLTILIADNDDFGNIGHPVHCKGCFDEKSEQEKIEIEQYYDPSVNRVLNYEPQTESEEQ